MYKQDLVQKKYKLPMNLPSSVKHKYVEVIEKEYAKYVDIIYHFGGYVMLEQMIKIVTIYEGSNKKESTNRKRTYKILKKLKELDFVKDEYINRYKYIYLRKAGLALATGDYKTSKRISAVKNIKNEKFKIAITKAEYFLEHEEIITNQTFFHALLKITHLVKMQIKKNEDTDIYSIALINKILLSKSFKDVFKILEDDKDSKNKLGHIYYLWTGIGKNFINFINQNIGMLMKTEHFNIRYSRYGKYKYVIDYIPNVVIFDIDKSYKYLKNKIYNISFNYECPGSGATCNLRSTYNESKKYNRELFVDSKKTFAKDDVWCRYGLVINIISNNKKLTEEKKEKYNEKNSSSNVRVGEIDIIEINTDKYFLHASRGNKIKSNKDKKLHSTIYKELIRLRENSYKDITGIRKL